MKAAWLKKIKNNTMFRNYTNYEIYFLILIKSLQQYQYHHTIPNVHFLL